MNNPIFLMEDRLCSITNYNMVHRKQKVKNPFVTD